MRHAERCLVPVVLAFSTALMLLHFNLVPILGDEGVLAMDGWRICRGEVPHRDFFQFIPPLAAFAQSLSFHVFSPSVFAIRIVGLLYGLALLLLSLLFFRKFLKNGVVLALSLCTAAIYGLPSWLIGSHHWLCDILQFAGCLVLIRALGSGSVKLSALAGALLGLAAFALQDQGAYAVIATLAAGFLFSGAERKPFLVAASAAAAAFCLLALPLAILAGPAQLFHDWLYFPLFGYKQSQFHSFSLTGYFSQFADAWSPLLLRSAPVYGTAEGLISDFLLLTPLLTTASLTFLFLKNKLARAELAVVGIVSLSSLACSLHRASVTNFTWGFAALLPFFVVIDQFSACEKRIWKHASLCVASFLLAIFFVFGSAKAGLALRIKNDGARDVSSNAGSYRLFDPVLAASLQGLLDTIDASVPGDEPLFCAGYVPLVNFMAQRPNPTRFNFMVHGSYYSNEQASQWAYALQSGTVEWGVSDAAAFNEDDGRRVLPGFKPVFRNSHFILWNRSRGNAPSWKNLGGPPR